MTTVKQARRTLRNRIEQFNNAAAAGNERAYDDLAYLVDEADCINTLGCKTFSEFVTANLHMKERAAYNFLRAGRIRRIMRNRGVRYPHMTGLSQLEWVSITAEDVNTIKKALMADEQADFADVVRQVLQTPINSVDLTALPTANPAVHTTLLGVKALLTEDKETLREENNVQALTLALLALSTIVNDL